MQAVAEDAVNTFVRYSKLTALSALARHRHGEDLRRYQLHMVDRGTSPVSIDAAITGLKFFFEITLDRHDVIGKMRPVSVPRKLPVVLITRKPRA